MYFNLHFSRATKTFTIQFRYLLLLFSYFCAMKRFLSFIFIVIALVSGAITFTAPNKGASTDNKTSEAFSKQTADSQQTIYFDCAHSLTSGQEILHNIHTFQLQQPSIRVFSNSNNAFRLKKLKQEVHLQHLACRTTSIRKAAFMQYEGYYLYHLRKLLI